MKNFWLERKAAKWDSAIHAFDFGHDYDEDNNNFVDLSQVKQNNSRYKEYNRLKIDEKVATVLDKTESRWKRTEIMSALGTFLIMKDDHMDSGQWLQNHTAKIETQIEEARKKLENHRKGYEKATTKLSALNIWIKEYEKLCESFEEVYQKKHPLPGKEYVFVTQDGNKFKGKFQEPAKNLNSQSRMYPLDTVQNLINSYKETHGSGKNEQ